MFDVGSGADDNNVDLLNIDYTSDIGFVVRQGPTVKAKIAGKFELWTHVVANRSTILRFLVRLLS